MIFFLDKQENLKRIIEGKGLDIITVASIADIENKQIYRLINAENEPRITTLLPIAKTIDIHPQELFNFQLSIKFHFLCKVQERKVLK